MHANHHASAIGEEVRKGSGGQLLEEIADFAMWLFTVVRKLQGPIGTPKPPNDSPQESLIRIAGSYSDMLWNKFPGICPLCYWRRTRGDRKKEQEAGFRNRCDCISHDNERRDAIQKQLHSNSLRAYSNEIVARKPAGVDDWQKMFSTIFAVNLRHLDLSDIALHLLEEMGEVSDALVRMYTYKETDFITAEPLWRQVRLEEELSDVSSWLFALVEKLNSVCHSAADYVRSFHLQEGSGGEYLLLSQVIWQRYGSDSLKKFACWKCGDPHCRCQIILVPPDRSVADLRGLIVSPKNSELK